MLQECNGSTLPGGGDGENACATWTMARKLNRGAKKWKLWVRQNIVDVNGVLGDGPAANADNFASCYDTLFTNEVAQDGKTDALYDEMQDAPSGRSWRSPNLTELRTAVGELRSTAPGLSVRGAILGLESPTEKCTNRTSNVRRGAVVLEREESAAKLVCVLHDGVGEER